MRLTIACYRLCEMGAHRSGILIPASRLPRMDNCQMLQTHSLNLASLQKASMHLQAVCVRSPGRPSQAPDVAALRCFNGARTNARPAAPEIGCGICQFPAWLHKAFPPGSGPLVSAPQADEPASTSRLHSSLVSCEPAPLLASCLRTSTWPDCTHWVTLRVDPFKAPP